MELLVIRHGAAQDASARISDAERPLTEAGKKEMRDVARRLRQAVPALEVVATSPLVRARETAEIVAEAYQLDIEIVAALSPGGSRVDLMGWLGDRREECVAVVGHAPDLDGLIAWLTTGAETAFTSLSKGSACLIRLPPAPGRARAELRWVVSPKLLKRITS